MAALSRRCGWMKAGEFTRRAVFRSSGLSGSTQPLHSAQAPGLDLSGRATFKIVACNCLFVVVSRMRPGCIILSSILLSCLSIHALALALDPGDIAEPSISAPDMTMPVPTITAPASSGPNMDLPKPETKSLIAPDNNTIQTKPTGNMSPNQSQASQKPQTLDVSGKWSIKFDKRTDRSLDLNLWSSSKNRILGYGTLTEEGVKYSVTASGSINEQELTLTTKSATPEYATQKFDEYDLDLFMANSTLSGTYVLSSDGQSSGEGSATAVRQQ